MSVSRIAYRFAKALIDLSQDQGNIEAVKEDINLFLKVAENKDFALLLSSPIVKASKKTEIFKSIFESKVQKSTALFFDKVIAKGREGVLVNIANEFLNQYKVLNGISTVKLTTATPITEENLKALKVKLLKSEDLLDKLDVEVTVDPTLIGGYKIEFDNKLYDASVAYKLGQMKNELLS